MRLSDEARPYEGRVQPDKDGADCHFHLALLRPPHGADPCRPIRDVWLQQKLGKVRLCSRRGGKSHRSLQHRRVPTALHPHRVELLGHLDVFEKVEEEDHQAEVQILYASQNFIYRCSNLFCVV